MRVYAEDPVRFLPGPGAITRYQEPSGEGIRVDSGYAEGDVVTPHYDPLLAKLCVWALTARRCWPGPPRRWTGYVIEGPKVNLPFFDPAAGRPGLCQRPVRHRAGRVDECAAAPLGTGA